MSDRRFILRSDAFDPRKIKVCTSCKEGKPCTSEFFTARTYQPTQACAECRECKRIKAQNYRLNNLEKSRACSRISARRWCENNKERRLQRDRIKRQDPEYRAKATARIKARRDTIPAEAVRHRVGVQIRNVLRTRKGGRSTFALLGYSAEELISHIERQFTRGMDWTRLTAGEIHIDHIVPLSSFDFHSGDIEEVTRRAWALTNLRPVWAADNLRKGDRKTHLL